MTKNLQKKSVVTSKNQIKEMCQRKPHFKDNLNNYKKCLKKIGSFAFMQDDYNPNINYGAIINEHIARIEWLKQARIQHKLESMNRPKVLIKDKVFIKPTLKSHEPKITKLW